jgi:hypothetical protein
VGEKTSKNRWVPDIKPQRYMITMNINLDTRIDPQPALLQFLILGPVPYKIPVTDRLIAHRQTDQRALVEIIQRPSVRAGSPVENLSVRPSVRASSAGGLKRGTVVSRTDGREFILVGTRCIMHPLSSDLAIYMKKVS